MNPVGNNTESLWIIASSNVPFDKSTARRYKQAYVLDEMMQSAPSLRYIGPKLVSSKAAPTAPGRYSRIAGLPIALV
jgi:hypothetical protein